MTDLKNRKIPNKITLPFAIGGLILHLYESGWGGAKVSLLGFLLGFFIFLFPYILGVMGAGDVKLMAALGAITSWKFILYTSLYTALVGGIIVIIVRARSGGVLKLFKDVGSMLVYGLLWLLGKFFPSPKLLSLADKFYVEVSKEADNYIPYAIAIGLGSIICLAMALTGRLNVG